MAAMTIRRMAVVLVAALAIAACAGSAGRNQRRAEAAAARAAVEAGDLRFDALTPQTLAPGACGMFLWSRSTGDPVLMLAALATPPQARVRLLGREQTLPRTAAEGQAAHGHFARQTFSDERLTLTVDVSFDEQRRMVDGATIERGVIRVVDRDGWETLIPVGGMVACQR